MTALRDSRHWDRQLEDGLPDSRLSGMAREHKTVRVGRMLWEKVFCSNCGCDGGAVTPEFAAHVFYVCDDCNNRLGPPAGCVEVFQQ